MRRAEPFLQGWRRNKPFAHRAGRVIRTIVSLLACAASAAPRPSSKGGCGDCHAAAQTAHSSNMARAMEFVEQCSILRAAPNLSFNDGAYRYRITRQGNNSVYTVTDGADTIAVPIRWALGQGSAGQTYIFELHGELFESRVSYFEALRGLGITMGAQSQVPQNLREAAGRVLSPSAAKECIGCHATNAVRQNVLQPSTLIPGIQCARCHESAERHAETLKTGDARGAKMMKLGRFSTEEMSNFCGQCHRTWEQIAAAGPHNLNNVRFQPYRLVNSKCYDAADPRVKCTMCHDPHGELSTKPAAYDPKCQACHSDASRKLNACPVANKDCVTCHMPKYELPGAHHSFTDHWIRVVRKDAPYPS